MGNSIDNTSCLISSKYIHEECIMLSKIYSKEVMAYDKEIKVSFLNYLEALMRGCNFIFDSLYLLHYKDHEMNYKPSGSYEDFLDWIKINKKSSNKFHCHQSLSIMEKSEKILEE